MSDPVTSPEVLKRRRSCLVPGCLTVAVLVFLSLTGLILGYVSFLHRFTATQPARFPGPNLTAEQMNEVIQRLNVFREALRAAEPTPPLALTSEDLNALLISEPALHPFTNRIHISRLEGDTVHALVSVPLDKVRFPMMKGRFLNGDAAFKVSITNGTVNLNVEQIIVDGRAFPDRFMDAIRSRNLATELNNNPRASAGLNRLQSIEVKDDKLVIVPELEK